MEIGANPPSEERPPGPEGKWRSRARWFLIASASLLVFALGPFALVGRSLASTMFGDAFFAAAFSFIPVAAGFPLLVGFSFLARWICERLLHRRLPGRRYIPWLVPAGVGLACLIGSFLLDRSPGTLFHDYLNINPPPSLANFQYWWDTAPGDSLYVFSFELEPSQFNTLLASHQFVEDSSPADIRQALKDDFLTGWPGFSIQLPEARLVTMYKYSTESPPGLPHFVEVLTTADHRRVIICGDN